MVADANDCTLVYTSLKELKETAAEIDWRSVVGYNKPATPMKTFLGARAIEVFLE